MRMLSERKLTTSEQHNFYHLAHELNIHDLMVDADLPNG